MLRELHVAHYAVVNSVTLRLGDGLHLLTGETGSGKSIVVDSLALLFGGRASADVVRAGEKKARLRGIFAPEVTAELGAVLDANALELEDGELAIEREILASGKSRAFVNGRLANLALLKELAPLLGDIHGQHETQSLFSARAQAGMLDAFAGTVELAGDVARLHRERAAIAREIAELRASEQERLRMLDLYAFQHTEIEEAGISDGEDARLDGERKVLLNLANLQQAGNEACARLYDEGESAAAQLKRAAGALGALADVEGRFKPIVEQLEGARVAAEDAALEVRSYLDGLEASPARLEEIEERLAGLEKLKRKYGPLLDDVIAFGAEAGEKVEALQTADERAAGFEKGLAVAETAYRKKAAALTKKRKAAAKRLEKAMGAGLGELAMPAARLAVEFEAPGEGKTDWGEQGLERVRFFFSANAGQPPRALAQVASGGELSRVTLALKTALLEGSAGETPRTLVFDEIDTGVGGRVAEAIGRKLRELARTQQVVCVTHLPQVAGFGDAHYVVSKAERGGQSFAEVARLDEGERVAELARMLSGERVTEAAEENARAMLAAGRR